MLPKVVVSRRGVDRIRSGHPWIYRSDIVSSAAEPGDLVRVVDEHDRPFGSAFWSSASQISLRLLATEEVTDELRLFRDRLQAAITYRKSLGIQGDAARLVHGEADRLPGFIVDRYADYLVVQTLCQGTDKRTRALTELLVELLHPSGILARNDPKVRRLEGLEERVDVLYGEVPDQVEAREGPLTFHVDVRRGQKTGLFLDQRENHLVAGHVARGRALDAFTYSGGFALAMAPRCSTVLAIDSSPAAAAATRANAASNGLSNIEVREANVFDELRELEVSGERFDTIVLDPPAFAKNRASVERAVGGYKEINLRALKLLSEGGYLITCSCSYNVHEELFKEIVSAAASDARAVMSLVESRRQARDHPVLLNVPETHYLKCLILRKVA
jgi:23S rRNA (cytosine1962-C5)-methyltransferase